MTEFRSNPEYFLGEPRIKRVLLKFGIKETIFYIPTTDRAKNLKTGSKYNYKRINGLVRCSKNFIHNVLLPNGDVAVCCNDYGLEHILGNLLFFDYNQLFNGKQILKVREALKNNNKDILCRYCMYDYDNKTLYKLKRFFRDFIIGIHTLRFFNNCKYIYRFIPNAINEKKSKASVYFLNNIH